MMKANYQRSVNAYWAIFLCIVFNAVTILIYTYLLTLNESQLDIFNQILGITTVLAIFQLITLLMTAVLFILWFHRAYFNLHQTELAHLRYTEGWAAGGWFVPILNLVVPYRIMNDIWKETQKAIFRNDDFQPTNLIGAWWLFWIFSNILHRIFSNAETMEAINQANMLEIASSFLNIGAGVAMMIIIKRLRVFENTLYESRMNQQESILFDIAAPADDMEMDKE